MKVVATKDGFYAGIRRRAGTRFDVKDGVEANWFVPVERYVAPVPQSEHENPLTMHQAAKRQAQSFVDLMKSKAPVAVDDEPHKNKGGRPKKNE